MEGLDAFLDSYGLAAVFLLMLVKAIGVPIPIPGDVVLLATAARVAEGKMPLLVAFVALLVAMVGGGAIQFLLARGPGRKLVFRYGKYLGLTPERLERAAAAARRGGILTIGLAILTPGLRTATVPACGLAATPFGTFFSGLALGSTLDLALHFLVGFLTAPILWLLAETSPPLWLLAVVLLVAGLAAWIVIRRRQRPEAPTAEVVGSAVAAWEQATCPVCLTLGSVSPLRDRSARPSTGPG